MWMAGAAAQSPSPPVPPAPSTEGCTERAAPAAGLPRLVVGTCVLSTLDGSDPLYQERSRYEEYELPLRRGEAVQIDMDALPAADAAQDDATGAYGFDTFLEIRRAGTLEPLMVNDDRPDSLNSRLAFLAPDDGSYTVTARSFGSRGGRYMLRVTAVAAEIAEEISGNRIPVELPALAPNTSRRARAYYFEGHRYERVRLTVPGGPTPIYLELADDAGAVVASQWSVENRPTELIAVLPGLGRYYLRVSSDAADAPARFEINMEHAISRAAAPPERIQLETPVVGALTIGSGFKADGDGPGHDSFYQLYQVQTRVSEPVTISVDSLSPTLDPVVDVGAQSLSGFAVSAFDDDSGGNFNSRLVLPPPHPATLLIRVRSFTLALGEYRLSVSQAPHTQRVVIHFAGTITREGITALADRLRSSGWQVQGDSQRIANAEGFNEVRYSAEADRAGAEALAAATTQAAVGARPVTTRQLSIIRPGILEVWISN
jgi:hypothetical protein